VRECKDCGCVADPYGLSALYVWEFQFLKPNTR
jgi:hypothetical protein